MVTRNITRLGTLFFMAAGSVCVGPAIEAMAQMEPEAPTEPTAQTAPAEPTGPVNEPAPEPAAASTDEPAEQPDAEAEMPAPDADMPDAEMIEVADEKAEGDVPEGQQVDVGSFGQIDLHVKDLTLTKVLQLLSMQSQRNIVASRNVNGQVSADLYDVGFYEALDAILHTNGFGYIEKGNFIYVYTQDELRAIEEQNRKPVTKVVRLDYITAGDASAFVSPMLSSSGTISVSGETEEGMQPTMQDSGADSFAHAATLLVRDYPENVEEIVQVLEDLDQRPRQVLIEATVLQAQLSEANAYGVDFAIFADLEVDDFTQPLGSVDDLISGTGRGGDVFTNGGGAQGTAGQTGSGQSTLKLGFLGNDAAVFIKALDSVTDTTVLATPKVLVLNRQRAELLVGQRLGYLSTTATDTSTTQTVEFLDIGTQLTVRPFVSDDGFVRMELRPQVSNGDTELVGGFIIPNETTQELTSNVMVESGRTVVLGGLFKEDTTVGRRQVPLLGDVPVVGPAFRGQDDSVQRSEVIFLIKPTVMKDQRLAEKGERAKHSTQLAQIGARESLLPWSRTKLTHSHLKKAYEYKRLGNIEKALWHTDLALHANPTMVEALRLKEKLSGDRMMVRDRSVLQDAVNGMVDEEAGAEEVEADAQDEAQGDAQEEAQDEADGEAVQPMDEDASTDESMDAEPMDAESDAGAESGADADAEATTDAEEADATEAPAAMEADASEESNEADAMAEADAATADADADADATEAEAETDVAEAEDTAMDPALESAMNDVIESESEAIESEGEVSGSKAEADTDADTEEEPTSDEAEDESAPRIEHVVDTEE